MADPLRVFIASVSADERAILAARIASDERWRVVSDAAWADVVLVSPEEWARLAPRPPASRGSAPLPVESLTPREIEVLRHAADGLPNRAIAERMGVTEHTVKFHLAAVFGKLGAATRTEAVQKGLRMGLIEI
jgi:DNA-binding NarL/FixJ family response regulator